MIEAQICKAQFAADARAHAAGSYAARGFDRFAAGARGVISVECSGSFDRMREPEGGVPMTATLSMLETYPAEINFDRGKLAATIDTLISCSEACTACADACLSEGMVEELIKCIRTDMDCADICQTTSRVLARHTGYDANVSRAMLQACIVACKACGDECAKHAEMHEHCRVCADACRDCEAACRDLLAAMG